MAIRIFVSSTWEDLQPERKAIENCVHRMQDAGFVGMEYFGSRSGSPGVVSLEEVSHSDIYIGIFAYRYGSGITEEEYRQARKLNIPCLIYFKDEEEPVKRKYVEDDPDRKAKLDSLKSEIQSGNENLTTSSFTNPDNLTAKVVTDVYRLLNSEGLYRRPRSLDTQCQVTSEYEKYMDLGNLMMEQGSLFIAEQNFKLALEESKKAESNSSCGWPLIMLAKTKAINSEYEMAANLLEQAIEVFEKEANVAGSFDAKIEQVNTYLDWKQYKGANKLHDAVKILDTLDVNALSSSQRGELKLLEGQILMRQGRYRKASDIFQEAIGMVGKPSQLYLHIKKAKAYALFRDDNVELARQEYEEAIQISKTLDLPHEEMLIYQDLMLMEYGLGNVTSSYRERWRRTREKIDNKYIRIERYHSMALGYLVKRDYSQAYAYLVREHKEYRQSGSMFDYGFINNLASLFSESQEYEKALECYIRLGETDKIERLCGLIVKNIYPDQITKVFVDLLGKLDAEPPVMERTGIAAALGNLYEISPDNSLHGIVEKLLSLVADKYSFIRNRDVKRNALKSLERYIAHRLIPTQLISEAIDRLIEASQHEVWFVREHVAKCFNAFLDTVPEGLQEKICNHLSEWLENEESDEVKEKIELSMTNLALDFKSPWKEKLIGALRSSVEQPGVPIHRLSHLAWLGEKIQAESLESGLRSIMGVLILLCHLRTWCSTAISHRASMTCRWISCID